MGDGLPRCARNDGLAFRHGFFSLSKLPKLNKLKTNNTKNTPCYSSLNRIE